MRALIITFSLLAIAALVVFGGLANAISGFGFDYAVSYNDPARVVATLIGDMPGIALALVGVGCALYDAARRGLLRWFVLLLIWPVAPLVAASLMYAGSLAYSTYWFMALAGIPLAAALYALVVPIAVPAALPVPVASGGAKPGAAPGMPSPTRFVVFVSALLLVALGSGALLLAPTLQPVTATPGGPPALQVSMSSSTADCAHGVYPPVTLVNTGSQALQWIAKSQDPQVSVSPAQGSLAPGASTQVVLSGKTTAPDVIVQFAAGASGASGGVAKVGCQAAAGTAGSSGK